MFLYGLNGLNDISPIQIQSDLINSIHLVHSGTHICSHSRYVVQTSAYIVFLNIKVPMINHLAKRRI